jgi:hypothetical protein
MTKVEIFVLLRNILTLLCILNVLLHTTCVICPRRQILKAYFGL